MDVRHRNGEASEYYVASRAKSVTDLKAVTHRNEPDGVQDSGVAVWDCEFVS